MSESINKVLLLGRLGKDPFIKEFDNGGKVASFSMCTNEYQYSKGSDPKQKAEWHNVQVKAPYLVDIVERTFKKGALVWVEGKIERRQYKSFGQDKEIFSIAASYTKVVQNSSSAKPDSLAEEPYYDVDADIW